MILALFVQWLVSSILAGAFFYFGSRSNGPEATMSLGAAFGFPAIIFGIGQLVRYTKES